MIETDLLNALMQLVCVHGDAGHYMNVCISRFVYVVNKCSLSVIACEWCLPIHYLLQVTIIFGCDKEDISTLTVWKSEPTCQCRCSRGAEATHIIAQN